MCSILHKLLDSALPLLIFFNCEFIGTWTDEAILAELTDNQILDFELSY